MKKIADLKKGGILIELTRGAQGVLEQGVTRLAILTKADLVAKSDFGGHQSFSNADMEPVFQAMDVWLNSIWPPDRLRELADELDALLGLKEQP